MTLGGAGGAAAVPYPPYGVSASSPAISLAVVRARTSTSAPARSASASRFLVLARRGIRLCGRVIRGMFLAGRRRRAGSVPHGSIDGGSAKDGGRSAMGGHLDGVLASGGEDDKEDGNPRKRKKRRPRRTPHQIQELEAFFKENDHPKQHERVELGKRLGLKPRQVGYWFDRRRRTRVKNQMECRKNVLLEQENDKLRAENMSTMMSGHLGVVSVGGGEDDDKGKPCKRKRQYRRFTPQQINQFEAFFKENHHPGEKQRAQLAMSLGVEPLQVQYWFQYRHKKNKKEWQEQAQLKQENDKLCAEILSVQGGMRDMELGEMPIFTISKLAGSASSKMGTVTTPVVTTYHQK
ncbi:unnamed protein product [Urochloa humidicola]